MTTEHRPYTRPAPPPEEHAAAVERARAHLSTFLSEPLVTTVLGPKPEDDQ